MFTNEEQHLFAGGDGDVHRFTEMPPALVVDWKGGEDDVLSAAAWSLPPGALTYGVEPSGEGRVRVSVRFGGREREVVLPARRPVNAFHVVLLLADVLMPDYETRVFRLTAGDDTPCFLIRPAAWWAALRTRHAEVLERVFDGLDGFRAATGPVVFPESDPATPPVPPTKKPWWRRG